MDKMPPIKLDKVEGLTFVEQIMKPHTPYYKSIKGLFDQEIIHGMAHITGGGIEGNLCRIIPDGLRAKIDLSKIKILNIFKYIRNNGNISDEEMLRTFWTNRNTLQTRNANVLTIPCRADNNENLS